jgi:hypothetical protein
MAECGDMLKALAELEVKSDKFWFPDHEEYCIYIKMN